MNAKAPGEAVAPLLDETTAAEVLGVSPRTLGDWRRQGIGPRFVRMGRRLIRYARADVDAFVAAGREGAGHVF
jgi:excisionase family DNA binding protein